MRVRLCRVKTARRTHALTMDESTSHHGDPLRSGQAQGYSSHADHCIGMRSVTIRLA